MMVNAESSLEGEKGNVCWQLGRGEGGESFLQLQSPCPGWAPLAELLMPWLGVTARFAHTDVTVSCSAFPALP